MGLETATTINQLVETNPDGGDPRNTLDDHLRLVKAALKNTFPGITGEVSASHGAMNMLVGVNQNIQTQFNLLREGTATARNAINARYANSASYAQTASSAAYALASGNANTVRYAVLASTISLSASVNFYSATGVTLSQTGMWMIDGVVLGAINNSALSATVKLAPGAVANQTGHNIALFSGGTSTPGGEFGNASLSFNVASVLRSHELKFVAFEGPAPGVANFITPVRGHVNVSNTAVVVSIGMGARDVLTGQTYSVRRGSYIAAERLGDPVP